MNKSFEDKIIEELTSIKNEVKHIKGKDEISNLVDADKFSSYFIWLSAISLIIIFSYLFNIDNKEHWARNYLFWGSIGGKIILSILVLNYIYRFNFIRYFFELKFTKFISGLIFSAAVLYSTSKASSLINEIFSVSATNFPYSLTFTTVFYSINYIANILSIIALILTIIFVFLELNHYIDKKEFKFDKEKGTIIIFFLFFIISLGLQHREFSENSIRFKAYQLALAMDFNKKYSCDGIPSNFSVAYIGNNQQKVIINMSSLEENIPLDFENFLMNSDKGFISKLFIVQPCLNNKIPLQQGSNIINN